MEVDDCDHQSRTDAAGPARTGSTRPGGAPEPSGSEPDGLRHGHGWIPINGSLITKVTQITIVTSATLPTSTRRPPLERCDMPPRPRIASISVASAAAIGLSVAIGVAPPAFAEPCTGAAAAAQPPAAPPPTPSLPSSSGGLPTGHRPPNTNERAPLPRLGQLPLAILNALSPRSERLQRQAAVVPAPNPPGTGNQPPPNAAQPVPNAAPAPPGPLNSE